MLFLELPKLFPAFFQKMTKVVGNIGGLAQRLQLSEAGINKVLAALRKKGQFQAHQREVVVGFYSGTMLLHSIYQSVDDLVGVKTSGIGQQLLQTVITKLFVLGILSLIQSVGIDQ